MHEQRISGSDARNPAEVTICGPEFAHFVSSADRRDAGIMNSRTRYLSGSQRRRQFFPISGMLSQQSK
jgi:hypothetical protein